MNCLQKGIRDPRCLAIVGAVVVWFVLFPSDLETFLTPVRSLISLASELLWLTASISPWAYLLAAVVVICWTWRTRGGSSTSRADGSL